MTLKQVEAIVTKHLIESTGITTRLSNIEKRLDWVFYIVAGVLVALIGNLVLKGH